VKPNIHDMQDASRKAKRVTFFEVVQTDAHLMSEERQHRQASEHLEKSDTRQHHFDSHHVASEQSNYAVQESDSMTIAELCRRLHARHITTGQLFTMMDADRSNRITYTEFCQGIAMSGVRPLPTDTAMHGLFQSFDIDKDGTISYAELVAALEHEVYGNRTQQTQHNQQSGGELQDHQAHRNTSHSAHTECPLHSAVEQQVVESIHDVERRCRDDSPVVYNLGLSNNRVSVSAKILSVALSTLEQIAVAIRETGSVAEANQILHTVSTLETDQEHSGQPGEMSPGQNDNRSGMLEQQEAGAADHHQTALERLQNCEQKENLMQENDEMRAQLHEISKKLANALGNTSDMDIWNGVILLDQCLDKNSTTLQKLENTKQELQQSQFNLQRCESRVNDLDKKLHLAEIANERAVVALADSERALLQNNTMQSQLVEAEAILQEHQDIMNAKEVDCKTLQHEIVQHSQKVESLEAEKKDLSARLRLLENDAAARDVELLTIGSRIQFVLNTVEDE